MTDIRLTRWQLILYGLPGLPLAAVTLPVYIQVPTFYAVELGLGLGLVGTLLLATRLWDVVTDPLVGFLSDRYSTRLGRRRPWLLIGMPVTAIASYALFAPPDDAGVYWLLGATLLLYLGWTMAMLPYNAWGAELSGDYHHRTTITASREGFVVLGTLLAVALPALLTQETGEQAEGLAALAIVLAILLPVTCLAAVIGLPDPSPERRDTGGLREQVARTRRNKPFWRLLLAWFLNGFANGLPATLFLLFVEYRLELPGQSGILLLTYFLAAVAGLPLWLWLGKRWGKHRCWSIAMIWACLWFAYVPFLESGDFTLFFIICVATGISLGADLALPSSMQADVVDVDTAEGGSARTGAYFALWGMAQKLSLALAVGIAFPLLQWVGFDPAGSVATGPSAATGAEDPNGVWMIPILYGIVPIVFKCVSIAVVWYHPITETTQQELQNKISRG